MNAITAELANLLADVNNALENVKTAIPCATAKIKDTSCGLSFLQVKNHCMMSYMQALCMLMSCQAQGKSLQDCASRSVLIEMRAYMEKISPMESKLKYRIDKLLRQNDADELQQDALSFKPNLDALDEDEESNEESESEHTNVYRPPKLAPVNYDQDKGRRNDASRAKRLKANAASLRLARELEQEYSEAPEQYSTNLMDSMATESIDAHFNEKQAYEEDHFVRVNFTREEKKLRKQRERKSMTDEVHELMGDLDQGQDNSNHQDMLEYLNAKRSVKRRRSEQTATLDDIDHDNEHFLKHKRKAHMKLERQVEKDKQRSFKIK